MDEINIENLLVTVLKNFLNKLLLNLQLEFFPIENIGSLNVDISFFISQKEKDA